MVISRLGLESIARLAAILAPLLRAHALRAIPLFTSQLSIEFNRIEDSLVPSISNPKPPFIASPHPTPPPLWRLTHVAPRNASPTKFCTDISAVNMEPSLILAVSRYGESVPDTS